MFDSDVLKIELFGTHLVFPAEVCLEMLRNISAFCESVPMNNWNQYTTVVGSVKVKLNDGDNPTIEFLPAAIDGDDPLQAI